MSQLIRLNEAASSTPTTRHRFAVIASIAIFDKAAATWVVCDRRHAHRSGITISYESALTAAIFGDATFAQGSQVCILNKPAFAC